jgi:hypothetical protein
MLDFLTGDKFRAVTQAFGWPKVQFWTPLAFDFGRVRDINQTSVMPRAATRELLNVAASADLADLRSHEIQAHERALATPGLYSRVVALNPDRWQLVRFTLWSAMPAAPVGDCFEVLHLSQPESR